MPDERLKPSELQPSPSKASSPSLDPTPLLRLARRTDSNPRTKKAVMQAMAKYQIGEKWRPQ